jgi:hypothetical protein
MVVTNYKQTRGKIAFIYRILWTIRRTLIFKQIFLKKATFLPFLLLDCKARLKKKFLVYKTELTFKTPENRHLNFLLLPLRRHRCPLHV